MKKVVQLFVKNKKTGDIENISENLYWFEEEGMLDIEGIATLRGRDYEIFAQVEGEPIIIQGGTNNFGNITF